VIEIAELLGVVAIMLLLRWMDRVDARLSAIEENITLPADVGGNSE